MKPFHAANPVRPSNRFRSRLAASWLMVGLFSVAGGMSGGNCNVNVPGPGPGPGGGATGPRPVIVAADHILGSASARVTVVEYADFECPFCGRFSRNEFAAIKAQYIDTGKIRWVYRHFPLRNIHARAETCARASECAADQSMFFEFSDLVYANQGDLSDAALQGHATTLGLNRTDFDPCMTGSAKATRVQQDVTSGTALNVTSTPTFFVNARRVVGFQTAAELGAVIDQELGG